MHQDDAETVAAPNSNPNDDLQNWGPDPAEGVRKYVAHIGRGHGIGFGYSKRFIERFGHKELTRIIKASPITLTQVVYSLDYRGISQRWNEKTDDEHAAMMALLSFRNILPGEAIKICLHYGFRKAPIIVLEHPYQLSLDIEGIGFEKADKIAQEGNIDANSPERTRAALYHALHLATHDGDVYVSRRDWFYRAEGLLGRGQNSQLAKVIEELIEQKHVCEVILPGVDPQDPKSRVYYPGHHFRAESRLAQQLKQIAAQKPESIPTHDLEARIDEYELKHNLKLSSDQRQAVQTVNASPLVVITGGPGTGKTTTVRAITWIFGDAYKKSMSLAAFAGCAAKRLREASQKEALTIHRTLAYDPALQKFSRDKHNPIDSDIVILDETSMIDLSLFDHVTQATKIGSRLVLIGDVDQLPSIGPGAVLRDVVTSSVVPVIYLKEIFRQAQRSFIVSNASRILNGQLPIPATRVDEHMNVLERAQSDQPNDPLNETILRDYIDIEVQKPEDGDLGAAISQTVVRLIEEIHKRYEFKIDEDVQVLSAMRIKAAGADELNKALQAALNPLTTATNPNKKPNLHIGGDREPVSIGDKVMQQRNDYEKELYNGDIGYVTSVNAYSVTVDYKDTKKPRIYGFSDASDIKLAYASTIHKSQGSEYPVVILVITKAQEHMFNRNGRSLFYTAVTRGKKLVFVVHDKDAIEKAIREPQPRRTLLKERLQNVPIRFRTGPRPAPTQKETP